MYSQIITMAATHSSIIKVNFRLVHQLFQLKTFHTYSFLNLQNQFSPIDEDSTNGKLLIKYNSNSENNNPAMTEPEMEQKQQQPNKRKQMDQETTTEDQPTTSDVHTNEKDNLERPILKR